ncbi:hypothetical protein B0J12DRAFT_561266 [Macrophomina phaseolina]|uniref:Uncharacterized protein n=1 Tax=Macrophomina phaseolina TaxID=35725 RepID=A0ABQ8GWY1_9PEZI|nr:hypothetical protein B0J12DRAFT_561266 [Macrophomina phaseolina]
MAYRDYDDRPRYSSRRYEPNTSRSRDYEHVKGQQYPYDRRRPEYYDLDQRRTPSAADYDARYAEDLPPAYAYDPRDRDRYPPTPPPTASYRVERHRRASWPPLPTVEDIEVALAKEAANHAWEDGKRGDEAPNRGSVDQEPILVEVEEEMARFNQERRFVIVPGSGDGAEQPADDVRIRRSMRQPVDRQKAPPLQTDLRDPPVNTTRSRSPYSYSRTSAAPKERSSGDSYLSPESAASSTSRENSLPPSPPRSPRLRPHEGDARVRRDPGSRPASLYSLSRQSRYEVATTDDLDPYLQEPPPRIGIQSPSPTRHPTSKSTTSLPYPVDDIMPAEQSYQFIPESPRSPRRTTSDYHRGPVVVPIPTHVREEVDSGRSPLRRTLSEGSVQKERKEPRSVPSTAQGNEIQQEVVPDMPDLPLPPCPRSTYSSRYRDWYTLDSVPSFDICPDCLDNIIGYSMFRRYFERAHPTDLPKKCHFSSPWYRLAWLMTLKEKRRNLDLIFSLASITDTEAPCPGETKDVRTWYGLRNNRGNDFIPNLYICERDVLYLEALMPTLGGCFQPMDSSARICSFRSTSTRFPQYLDTLLEVHEQALKSRTGAPDMAPFLNLASAHAWKRECTRDEILLGNPWHFLPGIPEFTVCEECYEDVVYPEVKRGSRLADDVTRTLQFVPSDAEFTGEGNSCQLYSLRMRRVWARAVEDDDAVYLARKVRERRKIHRDLKNQERSLRRLLDETLRERELGYSYGSGSVSSGLAPERLKEELDAVRMEWKNWE